MVIDILTLFPEMFDGPFDESILKRAKNKALVENYKNNFEILWKIAKKTLWNIKQILIDIQHNKSILIN